VGDCFPAGLISGPTTIETSPPETGPTRKSQSRPFTPGGARQMNEGQISGHKTAEERPTFGALSGRCIEITAIDNLQMFLLCSTWELLRHSPPHRQSLSSFLVFFVFCPLERRLTRH
jgi:hypothetical protein